MSRSSEEVLLIVSHVKNKKCEGQLYMMGERVAWMQQSKSTFTVTHNYADVKSKRTVLEFIIFVKKKNQYNSSDWNSVVFLSVSIADYNVVPTFK